MSGAASESVDAPSARGSASWPPGPRGHTLLGVLPEIRRDPLGFFLRAVLDYGDIVALDLPFQKVFLVAHPDHIKHVLQDNHRNYVKGRLARKMRFALGEGLLTSEGEDWQQQRRLLQPTFQRAHIATLDGAIAAAVDSLIASWMEVAESGRPVDVAREMSRLTLDIFLRAMFGTSANDKAAAIYRAVTFLHQHANRKMWALIDLPEWVPTPHNRRVKRALAELDRVVYEIIETQRRGAGAQDNLLSRMIAAMSGGSETLLRDEAVTMLVAGHETTACGLTWIWYLLSKHPEVERRLLHEIASVLGGRPPTSENLPRLVYTKMVVQECLRLLPAVWWFARTSLAEDEIGGYRIPKGAIILLCQYVTNRHPKFWDNPEGFDPERFAPERSGERPHFAFFPFGGGPRICIGNHFAMMELMIAVPAILQRFRLSLVPGHPIAFEPLVALRAKYGVLMNVARRKPAPD